MNLRLRFEIMKRDGFKCMYCGASYTDSPLQVDHVHPKARGGGNDPTNLITSCFACNQGKKARPLNEFDHNTSDSPYAGYISEDDAKALADEVRIEMINFIMAFARTGKPNWSEVGPLVMEWFDDLYSAGCGDQMAMHYALILGEKLNLSSDREMRDLLRATATADKGFVEHMREVPRIGAWCPPRLESVK